MANLQIKGIDNELYEEIKKIAAEENRSVSQRPLFLSKTIWPKSSTLAPRNQVLKRAGLDLSADSSHRPFPTGYPLRQASITPNNSQRYE